MGRVLVLTAVAVLTGCPSEGRLTKETPSAAASGLPVAPDDAGWVLTPARLDGWLAYHRDVTARRVDAGQGELLAAARAELETRRRLGLTEVDLERIDEVVAAVVAQRTIATLTGAEAVKEFERVTTGLSAEQRQKVEQAFGDVRTRAQQVASLDAERARFGAAAVDLVLAREAEVTQVWNSLLNGQGDTR